MSAAADTLSHAVGDVHRPLRHVTIPAQLREAARRPASHDVLVVPHDGLRPSYGDLVREVGAIAAGLPDPGTWPSG